MIRTTIYGAGAVGGHLAARLATLPDVDVSVIARGVQLDAIRKNGLRLKSGDEDILVRPTAVSDPGELPPQDLVFVTLKAPSIPVVAQAIGGLLAKDACVVFFTNGIPWWMPAEDEPSVLDPDGKLREFVGVERSLGGIVYSANVVEQPGVVVHSTSNSWIVGEPDGSLGPRVKAVAALLQRAGFNSEPTAEIRREIWQKLILNVSANPVSALTRLRVNQVAADSALVALSITLRKEIAAVAAAMGTPVEMPPEIFSEKSFVDLPPVRPSMLQDVLANRSMEVDAILGQPHAYARHYRVATPALDVVLPLLRGLNESITQTG